MREEQETYVVETFGRPQAALVNLDEYEQFQRFRRERGDSRAPRDAETVRESAALYAAEQVIVGKLAWASEEGQLSVFPLPPDFCWLRHFTARHLAEFLTELLETLLQAQQTGDWGAVNEVIDGWKATANVEADPALPEAVDQGLRELQEGGGTSWTALRQELDL